MAKKSSEVTTRYIFETMDYGIVNENLDLVEDWLKKTNMKFPNTLEDIEKQIKTSGIQCKVWQNTPVLTKAKLLNNLANAIETHSTLLCQIELKSRNILTKDTENKSIPALIDYLKYYAGWVCISEKHFPDYEPYGLCACYLASETSLSVFAAIIAPALAAGNSIIFGVSSMFIPLSCFVSELCKNVGFPENTISFVETSNPEIFLTSDLGKITYIGNLYNKKFSEIQLNTTKNITSLHLGKSSSMVFDSADLDSACDSIVNNAWSYGGMFPCGINRIFVQETIFTDFVNRIKSKIEKLNVGYPNNISDKSCDTIIKNQTFKKSEMVDIINKLPLQIGHKTFGNNIIFEEEFNDVLSILAFRTANEAIQLANNSKYGLGISVWTENISLANEVTMKLQNGLIWINAHGNISANASFSPFKESGNAYFGGKDGFLEYMTNKNPIEYCNFISCKCDLDGGNFKKSEGELTNKEAIKKDVRNYVEIANKSFEYWNKVEPKVRGQCLFKLAELSTSLKIKNPQIVNKWVEYLYECSIFANNTEVFFQSNPNLKVVKEALGVVVIDICFDANFTCLQLIAAAVALGNAVIVLNYSNEMQEFLENLCKIVTSSGIPLGIFNAFCLSNKDIFDALKNHHEIQTYFINFELHPGCNFASTSRLRSLNDINFNSNKSILKYVTKNKFIWTSVGESF